MGKDQKSFEIRIKKEALLKTSKLQILHYPFAIHLIPDFIPTATATYSLEGEDEAEFLTENQGKKMRKKKVYQEIQYSEMTLGSYPPGSRSSLIGPHKFEKQYIITPTQVLEMQDIFGLEDAMAECIVCFTEPKDVIFLPCRHICVCNECHKNMPKCPVCRAPIASFLRFTDYTMSSDGPIPYPTGKPPTTSQEIGRAVQQECRDRSRMPSSA
eukprot:TRINITY_DN60897_c0_g1_i1.p1 TRINITY_DN60897_c0_g1~~TRINITY_DN60897_c0_g1_i1.p1  ORF type:complete len:237 (-),score=34.25 TRINITY_DN60897_c0_g1_i1:11-649(-)